MTRRLLLTMISIFSLAGCSTYPPIKTAGHVDIQRFMGDWYVIASIPTSLEKGAHNAVESYKLNRDGSVATTFSFRKGSFTGPRKIYHPTGYIADRQTNAIWRMQFVWPFKADYRILYVSPDYGETIIGRIKRDYVWIMARKPRINEHDYRKLVSIIASQGYDTSRLQRVPQQWRQGASE